MRGERGEWRGERDALLRDRALHVLTAAFRARSGQCFLFRLLWMYNPRHAQSASLPLRGRITSLFAGKPSPCRSASLAGDAYFRTARINVELWLLQR